MFIEVSMNTCSYHLCSKITERKFCSKQCKNKYYVVENRKKIKAKAVNYKGGACCLCGYKQCTRALEFHHVSPNNKSFGIAAAGYTRSWERVKTELDKTILVCSNCHAEIEESLDVPA
jgi:hypothetical protein